MKYLKTYEKINGMTFKEWLRKNPQDLDQTLIDCSGSDLIDLNGIEKFKNLKYLYCYSNNLTILPDLSELKNLWYLNCSNNNLPYNNLPEYKEWYKKQFPDKWNAKKYNL